MVFNIIIINNNAVTIEGKGENGDNNIGRLITIIPLNIEFTINI